MRAAGWPEGGGGKARRGGELAGVQTPLAMDRCTAPVPHMFSHSHVEGCVCMCECVCVWSLDTPEYQLCTMNFLSLAFNRWPPFNSHTHTAFVYSLYITHTLTLTYMFHQAPHTLLWKRISVLGSITGHKVSNHLPSIRWWTDASFQQIW